MPNVDQENLSNLRENLLGNQVQCSGGVIETKHLAQFKKLVIRATRCQAFVYSFDLRTTLNDQIIGDLYDKQKSIYVIAYHAGGHVQDKIRKICAAYNNQLLDVNLEEIAGEI